MCKVSWTDYTRKGDIPREASHFLSRKVFVYLKLCVETLAKLRITLCKLLLAFRPLSLYVISGVDIEGKNCLLLIKVPEAEKSAVHSRWHGFRESFFAYPKGYLFSIWSFLRGVRLECMQLHGKI